MTGKQSVFEEKTVKTEPIFRGKIISLQVDTVELPDGRTATREIVRHSGAVGIMALHEGKLLVVEQYRKALGRSLVEIPAGMLDAGRSRRKRQSVNWKKKRAIAAKA